MENFVLYEELGRSSHSTVYKGRRRSTINFVAVICIDKSRRARATNWVRCIHSIPTHSNIIRFKEWYETNRHLWLVIDLCSGGSLRQILESDGKLPIPIVRKFSLEIVRGLYFLHNSGNLIHGDLTPDRIFLDGANGVLKISNLSMSRKENENLSEIYTQIDKDCKPSELLNPDPRYRPKNEEILTKSGDMFALGTILYELAFGHLPINIKTLESHENHLFADLVLRLTESDNRIRMKWRELIIHPFFENILQDLIDDENKTSDYEGSDSEETIQQIESVRESLIVSQHEPQDKTPVKNNIIGSSDSDEQLPSMIVPTPRRTETKSADVFKKKQKMAYLKRTNSREQNSLSSARSQLTSSRAKLNFLDVSTFTIDDILRCVTPEKQEISEPLIDNHKFYKFNLITDKFNKNILNTARPVLADAVEKARSSKTVDDQREALTQVITYFSTCSPNEKVANAILESSFIILANLGENFDIDVLSKLLPVCLKYLQFKNSPQRYDIRIRAARLVSYLSVKLASDVRFVDAVNFLVNELRMNNNQKNVKPEWEKV